MGDELHPRFLSLRAVGRPNPLVIELDSDELYDLVAQVRGSGGIVYEKRLVER